MDEQEQREVNSVIDNYETQLNEQREKTNNSNSALASSTIYNQQDSNLIVFQLELDNILEKIEHLLRGDVIREDEKTGELGYFTPEDIDLIILNEYGVQLIMNVISFYLNRNTILSFYNEERINKILSDLGIEVSDLILHNYEKMGMTTTTKKSRYPLLVISVIHIIESTYKRSLQGGERESLRSARVVTQTEGIGRMGPMGQMPQMNNRPFKIWNPKTW